MLHHVNGRWSTECDRCGSSVDVVGERDKRGSAELERAGRFLESIGWQRLHRKNAGYRVDWWCPACVVHVKAEAQFSKPHTTAGLDMNPSPPSTKKGA